MSGMVIDCFAGGGGASTGIEFPANRNRRYCSNECRKLANAEKHRERSRRYARKVRRMRRLKTV